MSKKENEECSLRVVAFQNAQSIIVARQRAEQQLLEAKEALETRSTQLAQSLAMMRATLESSNEGFLVTDENWNVLTYNENFLRIWPELDSPLGTRNHRVILQTIKHEFSDPQAFVDRIEEIYQQAPAESYDLLETKNGRFIERNSRIQFVNGQNFGRVWCFRDITDRRVAEVKLQEETRSLELLNKAGTIIASNIELHPLLQAITDVSTELSGAKFGAFFYTGRDESGGNFQLYTLSGAPREAFEKFGHPRATPLFGPTFEGKGIYRSDDILNEPSYGQMAPHYGMPSGHLPVRSYLAVPVIARNGEVLGGLFFGHPDPGVFTERSERVIKGIAAQAATAIDNARLYLEAKLSAEERKSLLDAERAARSEAERISLMKDEFLATLSHELRTPLNAILGWSQMLLEDPKDEEELKEGLSVITRNARAQTQLVEDLLDMSRIISGKVQLNIQPAELTSIIEAAVEAMLPTAEAKNIRLRTILDPHANIVSIDPNRFRQVIWNLVSNAVKFTPSGGKIDVVLEQIHSQVEISVIDTGEGISPEFLPHVFERFRQADSSITRKHGGLGLGLSIVKQLVELHGGTVHVHSPGKGQGSKFFIKLPVTSVRKEKEKEKRSQSDETMFGLGKQQLTGKRILIVDDEHDARMLIKQVLEKCSAEVLMAPDADTALQLLQENKPDMLISDIGMPDKDGYHLIREVRSLPVEQGGKIQAIALTAFARSEDRTRALLAGYQVHISKPVEPHELIATIASLISR